MNTESLLQDQLESCINTVPVPIKRIVLAYSGGLDSSVLLHLLIPLSTQFEVLAWHVNHGLQQAAPKMESFCRSQANNHHLKFKASRLKLDPDASNLEARARQARYSLFERQLSETDCLLTAHHANDQAETFFQNAMRGSGSAGLSGIARSRPLGRTLLLRPLLGFSRQVLLAYAESHDLDWIDDPSNSLDRFNRNYFRNKITPLLESRWPNYLESIQSVVSIQAETQELLEEVASEDLLQIQSSSNSNSLPISGVLKLSPGRQVNLIRYWLRRGNYAGLPKTRLKQLIDQLNARPDAMPLIAGKGYDLRIYNQHLFLVPQGEPIVLQDNYDLVGRSSLEIKTIGLKTSRRAVLHRLEQSDNGQSVKIQFRQKNSGLNPERHRLKRLFQKYKIPPWERAFTPLIYLDNELIDLWVQDCATGNRP